MSTDAPVSTRRVACRACHAGLNDILDLGVQYLPRFAEAPDPSLPKAPLRLVRCSACGLLQLGDSVQPDLLYRQFWYRSGINESMRAALRDLVADGLRAVGRDKGRWLDIGANDGYLLSEVPKSFTRYACEPALNFAEELATIADFVISDYFSAASCDRPFNVITSAACFYDVDDPQRFVHDIATVLHPQGVWINQLNDAPGMMRMNAFDSICHEHVAYYDLHVLRRLYEKAGLVITNLSHNDVNGGSIRVTARHASAGRAEMGFLGVPRVTLDSARAFADRTVRWKAAATDLLLSRRERGVIDGYGASTKGGTLLQYLDLPGLMRQVADKNPEKHGRRMVGDWTPIVSEDVMRADPPATLFMLPWAFKTEFDVREEALRAKGTAMLYPLPSLELVL